MEDGKTKDGSATSGNPKLDGLVGSDMVQVLEITPAPTRDYDSVIVDATESWSTALEVIERVFDRQLDEMDYDPEEKWEGRGSDGEVQNDASG